MVTSMVLGLLVSLAACFVILKTKGSHLHLTSKGHAGSAVQSVHIHPTPRIGGIALALGLIAAIWVQASFQQPLVLVLIAALPVFLAGLAEDVGLSASPRLRLLAAIISAFIAIYLTGASIQEGVFPGFDAMLGTVIFGTIFTVFCVAATCHSFNLIDGMNGLAGSVALISCGSLGAIAFLVGDTDLVAMSVATFAATLGVFALNFPFGKVFLGDAGAYSLGFVIAWIGVLMISRHPDISVWAVLLTVFLPFIDTTTAILRRVAKQVPVGQPDKLHYHHLIKRIMDKRLPDRVAGTWANPLTTLFMLPVIVLPPVWAVFSAGSDSLSLLGLFLSIGLYVVTRHAILRNFRKFARPPQEYTSSLA